jgi:hypothetical protein
MLHHFAALGQMFSVIVRGANGVSFDVGKLAFYHVRRGDFFQNPVPEFRV